MTIHTTYHKHIALTLLAISVILCGIFHYTIPVQGANSPPVVKLPNPMETTYTVDDIPVLIGKLLIPVLGIIGSITLLVFVYGGFVWMTSGGSPEKIKKGTNAMLYAAIGLCIIFSAYGKITIVTTEFIK